MSIEPDDPKADPPFYPSGYTPEVNESDSGYGSLLHVRESKYSGPIPPPESLEYYESVLPGAADRILRMAEENAKSLRETASRQLDIDSSVEQNRHDETSKGQHFGLGATILAFSVTALALALGYPAVAGIISSATIVALAAVFVTGRARQEKQNGTNP